jgi:DNA-directed RNA polymerase specialized sigma subunit
VGVKIIRTERSKSGWGSRTVSRSFNSVEEAEKFLEEERARQPSTLSEALKLSKEEWKQAHREREKKAKTFWNRIKSLFV